MSADTRAQIDAAIETIESAGLVCAINQSGYTDKAGQKPETLSINVTGGKRPVSVWPIQGTVFSSAMKNPKAQGGGWKFKTAVRHKKLTFEQAIYVAVQVALGVSQ